MVGKCVQFDDDTWAAIEAIAKARRLKDAMRRERELNQAQIEHAWMQHWVMLT
jgi:hypothetical protein